MKIFAFSLRVAAVLTTLSSLPAALGGEVPFARLFPASGAANVCPDTPLRISFPVPLTATSQGKVELHQAGDGRVVETIDLGANVGTQPIGGLSNYSYYRVIVTGKEVTIFPRHGTLRYGSRYYVTIDAGAFAAGTDASAEMGSKAWQFSTKPPPAIAADAKLTVAPDGTGDFCTVQGAIDFIPDGNTTPRTIFIRRGVYPEIIFITNKHALTLVGEDRQATVIAYANNDRFNNKSNGNPFGAASPNPAAEAITSGAVYRRGVLLAHDVRDLTLANLTIRNTTPPGGSQAEAVILNGTTTAHAVLRDLNLQSFQDTLQINGQAYLSGCHIEGDVDFMWGTGPCFFEDCSFVSLRSGAYYTQIRNPPTNHGYVYLRCRFEGAAGVTGNYFTRVAPARFPASEVVLLDCVVSDAVGPVGWQVQGAGDTSRIHFWEFNSHDAAGKPVDASRRLPISRQLRQPNDAEMIAKYADPAFVLGGWNPPKR
jgi:pectin methylesterase-like acyl-CoA thioesterase